MNGNTMGHALAAEQAVIDAPASDVYTVIADYSTHHPHLMPASLFSDLQVESGGVGAGTVFHISLTIAGKTKLLHMRVAEPEPGRVVTETNLDTGVVTAFAVTPTGDGARTIVRISSEWETAKGIGGLADRLATPVLMRWIYRKQLAEIKRYMRTEAAKAR